MGDEVADIWLDISLAQGNEIAPCHNVSLDDKLNGGTGWLRCRCGKFWCRLMPRRRYDQADHGIAGTLV